MYSGYINADGPGILKLDTLGNFAPQKVHRAHLCYILLAMTLSPGPSLAATSIVDIFIEHSTSPNNIRIKKEGEKRYLEGQYFLKN